MSDVAEIFANLATDVDARDLMGLAGACQFHVGGEDHFVFFEAGTCRAEMGVHPEPACRASMTTDDFLALAGGTIDYRLLAQRSEITGNIELIYRVQLMFQDRVDTRRDLRDAEDRSRAHPIECVDVVENPAESTLYDAMATLSRPLIIRGALGGWAALSWDSSSLAEKFPELGVRLGPQTIPMREFVERMLDPAESGVYSNGTPLPAEFIPYLGYPPFFSHDTYSRDIKLWMGAAGQVTPLHRDGSNALLCQVFGRKRALLYPPHEAGNLYPYERHGGFQPCHVANPRNVDLEAYPLFADARGFECTVAPGEILLMPTGWFHFVETLDPTLSVKLKVEQVTLGLPLISISRARPKRSAIRHHFSMKSE